MAINSWAPFRHSCRRCPISPRSPFKTITLCVLSVFLSVSFETITNFEYHSIVVSTSDMVWCNADWQWPVHSLWFVAWLAFLISEIPSSNLYFVTYYLITVHCSHRNSTNHHQSTDVSPCDSWKCRLFHSGSLRLTDTHCAMASEWRWRNELLTHSGSDVIFVHCARCAACKSQLAVPSSD